MVLNKLIVSFFCFCLIFLSNAQAGISDAHAKKADATIAKAIDYLRSTQEKDGSWSPKSGPAVTALIIGGMLDQPSIKRDDPMVKKAIEYILSFVQKDGSIHHGVVENYSTSICLTTLAKLSDDPKIAAVIKGGRKYLSETQWTASKTDPKGAGVDKDHPFWGGFGYGSHGRPDGSNSQFAVEAFIKTGSDCKDPEILAAVEFFSKLQGIEGNKKFGSQIQPDGGAIYATSIDKDNIGKPQSQAGEMKMEDGSSRLKTYGSMTYAMFKTYVYAQLEKDDPRVVAAKKWISHHYTLDYNPGMGEDVKLQGYFYYLLTFARAMDANGEAVITTADGKKHNWGEDLIDKLSGLQDEDGSWTNETKRWLESDANLMTGYALTALSAARY
ncbi:MAG: prenyltransferase/squalene oxidase repeat-containing protein [Phycisphaeraceae bacterium]